MAFYVMYYTNYSAPFGILRLVSDQQGLRQLWLLNPTELSSSPSHWIEKHNFSIHHQVIQCLDRYFAAQTVSFTDLPLAPVGTPFQQQVWQQLRSVAYGNSSHYAAVAIALNHPRAVRAVGNAISKNPIAILIPCHRVLGKNHSLTGYAGGLAMKQALLELENIPYCA